MCALGLLSRWGTHSLDLLDDKSNVSVGTKYCVRVYVIKLSGVKINI